MFFVLFYRMISINERIWANEGNEWHLVQSSIRVITLLANNAHSIWSRSKYAKIYSNK